MIESLNNNKRYFIIYFIVCLCYLYKTEFSGQLFVYGQDWFNELFEVASLFSEKCL